MPHRVPGRRRTGPDEEPRVPPGGRLLLHAPRSRTADGAVDVRPAAAASYTGDRVRLTLRVSAGRRRESVTWSDLRELEAAVGGAIERTGAGIVRFGDRSACRTAVGRAGTETVERRLAAVAARRGAGLLTWTAVAPEPEDAGRYDAVVEPSR